jgi:hypothetical protein
MAPTGSPPAPANEAQDASAAPDAATPAAANATQAAPSAPSAPQSAPQATSPQAAAAPGPSTAKPAAQRAAPGLSGRGTGFGNTHTGAALSARIRIEERVILDNVSYALKLFEAEHGRRPSSHEEFMQKIIQANSIQLPSLPEGQNYVYDPEQGELMVEQAQ